MSHVRESSFGEEIEVYKIKLTVTNRYGIGGDRMHVGSIIKEIDINLIAP